MDHPDRKPLRLPVYDYAAPAAHFVTLCVKDRICCLGDIENGQVILTVEGGIVQKTWKQLPLHYPNVMLDEFIVMPTHIHGIIYLIEVPVGAGLGDQRLAGQARNKPAPTSQDATPLSEIIRGFKTYSARRINFRNHSTGKPFWQRNYYEHIIRSETDLSAIRQYISNNPLTWEQDPESPREPQGISHDHSK